MVCSGMVVCERLRGVPVAERSGGWDEDLTYFEVDPGYWDDDLRGRQDDVYAAELYGYPFTPLELLYRRGAEEHQSLEELAGAWLSEVSRVGLPEHDPCYVPKQSDPRRPETDAPDQRLFPVSVGERHQRFWIAVGDSVGEDGTTRIGVLDRPLRTQESIIALLTVLEGVPTPSRPTQDSHSESAKRARHRPPGYAYVRHLLRYYRPSFDTLPREEQRDLIDATTERVDAFLKASRQLVEFLEYGVPGRKLRSTLRDANRDVRAAVLRKVEGLSSPRIAERFGLPMSDAYKTKHEHKGVEEMVERGRGLLVAALGEQGWKEQVEIMKQDREWFNSLDDDLRSIYLDLDKGRLGETEARRFVEMLRPETRSPDNSP
jgi:hypothetical protein